MQKKEVDHFLSFSIIAGFLCPHFSKIHFLLSFVSLDFLNFDGVFIYGKYIIY